MAIVQPIREDTFIAMMHGHGISDRGLRCLFRHLETVSEETDEDVMFDVEELLSWFAELSLEDTREYYGGFDDYPNDGDIEAVAEWLADYTHVIHHSKTHILLENF